MTVAVATRWFSQRLASLIRPLCATTELGTFALPPEIILLVTSYLNNASVASLALTCRTLYHIFSPKLPLLDLAEKEELLLLLEKDVAVFYFCHYCTKLHRWHKRWSKSLSPWYAGTMPCKRKLDNHLYHGPICHIPYYYARLVMNRHFYGSTHGPSPHQLRKQIHSYRNSDGIVMSGSQHARIVDDQLLVSSMRSTSHLKGDSVRLRSYIDSLGYKVCRHLSLSKGFPGFYPLQLSELYRDGNTSRSFLPCDQSFGSCPLCLTDYSINISWEGKKKGYVIKVLIYRQLGDCRSPFNWSWTTISGLKTKEQPRAMHSLQYSPGYVRNQWNQADGSERTSLW